MLLLASAYRHLANDAKNNEFVFYFSIIFCSVLFLAQSQIDLTCSSHGLAVTYIQLAAAKIEETIKFQKSSAFFVSLSPRPTFLFHLACSLVLFFSQASANDSFSGALSTQVREEDSKIMHMKEQ